MSYEILWIESLVTLLGDVYGFDFDERRVAYAEKLNGFAGSWALGALAALSLRVRDASHLDIVVLLKNFNRTMYQIDLLPCFSLR